MEQKIITAQVERMILNKIGALVQEKAIRLCPVDEGFLRSHIYFKIVGNTVKIYTEGVEYADKMEYGSPPLALSSKEKEEIERWAARHGLKSGKGVIHSLEKKGIKAGTVENPLHITSLGRDSYRPFLRPAVHQTKEEIKEIIKEAL